MTSARSARAIAVGGARTVCAALSAIVIAASLGSCTGAPVPAGDADSLTHQGNLDANQGRYAEAEPLFKQVLALRGGGSGSNGVLVGQALYNLGWLYRLEGRYPESEPLLRQALDARERALGQDHPTVAQSLNELGYLYQLEGRYSDAEPLYTRALAIQRKSLPADDPAIATTLVNLGYLYRQTSRFSDGERAYVRALAIREKALGPDNPGVARVLDDLGGLYRAQGRLAEAEPLEDRALKIREHALGPDHPEVADSLGDLGELYAAQRRFPEAERSLIRSVAIREKALGPNHPELATQGLSRLSAAYEAEGKTADALRVSGQAVDVLQRHVGIAATGRSNGDAAEKRLYRTAFLHNIALLSASGGDAAVARSFEIGQAASASTAGDAVAGMAARFAAGSDPLAAAVRRLQDLSARWRQLDEAVVRAAGDRSGADQGTLRASFDDTDRALRSAQDQVARDFPAYANLTNPAPVPLAAAQSLLAPDEAMIVYVVGDDATWMWALRQDRAAFFRIDLGAAALASEVVALRTRLDPWQNPSLQPFPARRAYALYQKIMAPAASFLQGAKQVLVVPDGALESLPLAVLATQPPAADPLKPEDNRNIAWFARDHAITVLPSVGALQALRRFASASRATAPFSGIGDPTLTGPAAPARGPAPPVSSRSASLVRGGAVDVSAVRELPPLPETAAELRTISHALGGSDDDLFLGRRASEPILTTARLDRYRVVEFATHGLMSGDLGLQEPALVLTPPDVATPDNDGLLTASKIATMKFDADWVVLSACNTAAGDGSPDSGGLSGLAKAFFYAGARSMLVSHWSVDSAATVKLTTGAFAALAKEPAIGRAEALRRSMMAMLDPSNPPELSHPMAWAPFVLAGEGGAGR